jgi:hypothetical protein
MEARIRALAERCLGEPYVSSCARFDRHVSPQAVPVTTDCRHSELPVAPETHRGIARGRIAVNFELIPLPRGFCGLTFGCKRRKEKSYERVDCDHVTGVLTRRHDRWPGCGPRFRPKRSGDFERPDSERVVWIVGSTDRHLIQLFHPTSTCGSGARHPLEDQHGKSNPVAQPVHPWGRTPVGRQYSTQIDRQSPAASNEVAGVAVRNPLQVVLMFRLSFPELADRHHLRHYFTGP